MGNFLSEINFAFFTNENFIKLNFDKLTLRKPTLENSYSLSLKAEMTILKI